MEAGGRVSYKPYRDVSKVFIQRLRRFAGVGVIEKASIDEAYIQYAAEPQHQPHGMTNMQQAEHLAQNIRHAGLATALLFLLTPFMFWHAMHQRQAASLLQSLRQHCSYGFACCHAHSAGKPRPENPEESLQHAQQKRCSGTE